MNSEGRAGDNFGYAVAISSDGSTIVVSALPGSGAGAGAAYVFLAPAGSWTSATQPISQTAKLVPSDTASVINFTQHLAVSSDGTTVVAHSFNGTTELGELYVFTAPGGSWMSVASPGLPVSETAQLSPEETRSGAFGYGFGMSADATVIVAGDTGANSYEGGAYVFLEPSGGGGWVTATSENARLRNSDPTANGAFGGAVAVDQHGDTIAIGAEGQNSDVGEAYVFAKPASGWTSSSVLNQTTKLTSTDFDGSGTDFGMQLSITDDGTMVMVGSAGDGIYEYAATSGWPSGSIDQSVVYNIPVVEPIGSDMLYGYVNGSASANSDSGMLFVAAPANNPNGASSYALSPGAIFVYENSTYGQPLRILPPANSQATAGMPYSGTFTASGGNGAITFSSTSLPSGLTLSSGGVLSGTPQVTGPLAVGVTATDTHTDTASLTFTLMVGCPTITVGPLTLPPGTVNAPYSPVQFTAAGGVGAITFSETGLPAGIGMTFLAGALGGTPTQAGGPFFILVTATDSNECSGSVSDTLTIGSSTVPPPAMVTDDETITVTDTDFVVAEPATLSIAAPVSYFSAGAIGFGSQSGSQTLTVSNIGDASLALDSASISGSTTFAITQIACSNSATALSTTLPSVGACTFTITYTASANPASDNATLVFTDNAGLSNLTTTGSAPNYTQSIALSGSGTTTTPPPPPGTTVPVPASGPDAETITVTDTPFVVAEPATLSIAAPVSYFSAGAIGFGSQSGSQTLTVSNIGDASLALASESISGSATFTITQIACSNGATSLSTTLPSVGACTFTIAYTSSGTPASDNATLAFTDNAGLSNLPTTGSAPNYTQSISLSGSGTTTAPGAPPSTTVTIPTVAEAITVTDTVSVTVMTSQVLTSTTLSILPGTTVTAGTAVTLTANVTTSSGNVGSVGTVTFYSAGTTALGSSSMSNGTGSAVVSGLPPGNYSITAVYQDSSNSYLGSSSAAMLLTVNPGHLAPPQIAATFGVSAIPLSGVTTLTFTISNPNSTSAISGVAFTDNLPSGLEIALPTNLQNSCGGVVTAIPGTGSIALSGAELAASHSCTVTVDVTGTATGTFTDSASVTSAMTPHGNTSTAQLTVQPGLLTPSSGTAGETLDVAFKGSGFVNGITTLQFSGSNVITVNSVNVVDGGDATANITISSSATAQKLNVAAATGTSRVVLGTFTIGPRTLTVSPNTGTRGETLDVTLTGWTFAPGTTVQFSSSAITVNSVTIPDTSEAIVNITIAPGLIIGPSNITITNVTNAGTSTFNVKNAFEIESASVTVSPNTGTRGETLDVTLTGWTFAPGTTVQFSSSAITVNSVTIPDTSEAIVNITIAPGLIIGPANITITNAMGTSIFHVANAFEIESAGVTVSPNAGTRGETLDVTLTGWTFTPGTTVQFSSSAITVNSVTIPDTSEAIVNITIAPGLAMGPVNLTITNAAQKETFK